METEPKITGQMTLHLNGGSKFSELHYKVLVDNKETGITRHTRTDGSPKYKKVADELHYGEDTFDILACKGVGIKEWIMERVNQAARSRESGSANG